MEERSAFELPIFELPLAIVPAELVPLHVFERRYRLMTQACLDQDSSFGIVLSDDEGARSVGCTAAVAEVVERHEDGRMDIIVRGGEPFRVLEWFEAADWPSSRVVAVEVELGPAAEELDAARAAFRDLLGTVGADPDRADAVGSAYAIAAQVELPATEKQSLLEMSDERARLIALEASLRKLLAGIARSRALAERARTNGHGTGSLGRSG